jgi:2-dehydropantoate 2-reductase
MGVINMMIKNIGIIGSGGACKILLGPDPDKPDANADELIDVLVRAGIKHEWKQGIQSDIWEKFIFIASYGLVAATYESALGDILSDASLKAKVIEVMSEAASLARGLGVNLDKNIVETSFEKGRNFPPETKTSFQRDFELKNKTDECELFAKSLKTRHSVLPGSFDYEFKDCVVKKLIYNQAIPYD